MTADRKPVAFGDMRNWMKALFWLAIAVVFLVSDNLSAGKRRAQ